MMNAQIVKSKFRSTTRNRCASSCTTTTSRDQSLQKVGCNSTFSFWCGLTPHAVRSRQRSKGLRWGKTINCCDADGVDGRVRQSKVFEAASESSSGFLNLSSFLHSTEAGVIEYRLTESVQSVTLSLHSTTRTIDRFLILSRSMNRCSSLDFESPTLRLKPRHFVLGLNHPTKSSKANTRDKIILFFVPKKKTQPRQMFKVQPCRKKSEMISVRQGIVRN